VRRACALICLTATAAFGFASAAGAGGAHSTGSSGRRALGVNTTIIVNSAGDAGDSDTGDGVCDDGTGACTLRAAIEQANATPGFGTVLFAIGRGPQTITPATSLPLITDPLFIDGASQPGFAGTPIIELSGAAAPTGSGLHVKTGPSTIRGMVVNRWPADGITLEGDGDMVQGNFIGTDLTGTIDRGNGFNGIDSFGNNTVIGGDQPGQGNLVSGNANVGIELRGQGGTVRGNLVGTNAAGTAALGNGSIGLDLLVASTTTVGGHSAPGQRNVISGNGIGGLGLFGGTGNVVEGNVIGTDPSGSVSIPNIGAGVKVTSNTATGHTIGGTAPCQGTRSPSTPETAWTSNRGRPSPSAGTASSATGGWGSTWPRTA